MNEKQVKKWAVASLILCYVFMMLPLIMSKLNVWVLDSGFMCFVTVGGTIQKVVGSALMVSLLILLIYSDNLLRWFEKTGIGKWTNTPVRGYYKK